MAGLNPEDIKVTKGKLTPAQGNLLRKLANNKISTGNLNAQGTITTSGSQSYTGTVDLTDDLSLSSTST